MIKWIKDDIPEIAEGDVDFVGVNCTNYLDADEVIEEVTVVEVGRLSGTAPNYTITESSDLTITNAAANTEAIKIKEATVAIGKGIQWAVEGQQSGHLYGMLFQGVTSAGRKVNRGVPIRCV